MTSLIRSCFLINKAYPALKRTNPLPLIYVLLLGLLFCFISTTIYAQLSYLQDNAHVVSEDMALNLEKELGAIQSRDGLYFEVIILPNFYNRDPEAVVDAYAQQLAKNAPSVDKRVLLLIVLDNKLAIIRPTSNIANAYDTKDVNEIIENIKKNIEAKKYDEMARIGIAGVYHYYKEQFPTPKPQVSEWKKYVNPAIFIIIVIAAIFYAVSQKRKTQ